MLLVTVRVTLLEPLTSAQVLFPPCTMLAVLPRRGGDAGESVPAEGSARDDAVESVPAEGAADAETESAELSSARAMWSCTRRMEDGRSMVVVEVEPSFI